MTSNEGILDDNEDWVVFLNYNLSDEEIILNTHVASDIIDVVNVDMASDVVIDMLSMADNMVRDVIEDIVEDHSLIEPEIILQMIKTKVSSIH